MSHVHVHALHDSCHSLADKPTQLIISLPTTCVSLGLTEFHTSYLCLFRSSYLYVSYPYVILIPTYCTEVIATFVFIALPPLGYLFLCFASQPTLTIPLFSLTSRLCLPLLISALLYCHVAVASDLSAYT